MGLSHRFTPAVPPAPHLPQSAHPPTGSQQSTRGVGRIFDSLRDRNYLFLWLGMLGSFMAMNMQMVARGYLAYDLTGSATGLGIVMMSFGIPQVLLALVGGVVADRFSKRNLLIATQALLTLTTLINAILISAGVIAVWHLVVLGLFQGAIFAFNLPARQALVPLMAGRERMANAIALNNTGMNLTRIVGPSIAGLLVAVPLIGIAGSFYVITLCYLLTLIMLFQLPKDTRQATLEQGSMVREMGTGLRYIKNQPALLSLLVTAFAVILLAMPYQTLMPVFALRVHNVGPEGLGTMMAVTGLGALVGSLTVAYVGQFRRVDLLQLGAGIGFGISLAFFAMAPSYPMALVLLLFVGAMANIYMALNNTLMMLATDAAMYGRVMSVYMITFSLTPVTALPQSMLADTIGAPLTIAASGLLSTVLVIILNLPAQLRRTRAERAARRVPEETAYAR